MGTPARGCARARVWRGGESGWLLGRGPRNRGSRRWAPGWETPHGRWWRESGRGAGRREGGGEEEEEKGLGSAGADLEGLRPRESGRPEPLLEGVRDDHRLQPHALLLGVPQPAAAAAP